MTIKKQIRLCQDGPSRQVQSLPTKKAPTECRGFEVKQILADVFIFFCVDKGLRLRFRCREAGMLTALELVLD